MNTNIKKILLAIVMGFTLLSSYAESYTDIFGAIIYESDVLKDDAINGNRIFTLVTKNNVGHSYLGQRRKETKAFAEEDAAYINFLKTQEGMDIIYNVLVKMDQYIDFRATIENFQAAGIDMISIMNRFSLDDYLTFYQTVMVTAADVNYYKNLGVEFHKINEDKTKVRKLAYFLRYIEHRDSDAIEALCAAGV